MYDLIVKKASIAATTFHDFGEMPGPWLVHGFYLTYATGTTYAFIIERYRDAVSDFNTANNMCRLQLNSANPVVNFIVPIKMSDLRLCFYNGTAGTLTLGIAIVCKKLEKVK